MIFPKWLHDTISLFVLIGMIYCLVGEPTLLQIILSICISIIVIELIIMAVVKVGIYMQSRPSKL